MSGIADPFSGEGENFDKDVVQEPRADRKLNQQTLWLTRAKVVCMSVADEQCDMDPFGSLPP